MAITTTGNPHITKIQTAIDCYFGDGLTRQGAISKTLPELALTDVDIKQVQIAIGATETFASATVFGSSADFKFVGIFVNDNSTTPLMQVEIHNSGHLIDCIDTFVISGSAVTDQVEIKNNSGANVLNITLILGR